MSRLLAPRTAVTCLVLALLGLVAPRAEAAGDQYRDALWGLKKVGAERAWSAGTGSGITIAIVDSGVDAGHEDLKANIVRGYDFVDDDDDPSDRNGHGTHVAGIAAAVANNGVGVAGVAPNAKIMPVRVLDEGGRGSLAVIEKGVRWAVANGADVVNLSLSSDVLTEFLTGGTLADAVDFAWSRGVVAVISAGNDRFFRSELRQARAMVVTATTHDDRKAPYATGVGFARWGIAAPGGSSEVGRESMVLSTWWEEGDRLYTYSMGTSMATAHVSGAVALLRGMGLTPQQTVDRLLSTARDLGARGRDSVFGHGRLDVAAAASAGAGRGSGAGPELALMQAGAEGSPGADGSSAEGASATGRPGSADSGQRGAPGDRITRRTVATATPTIEPTQRPEPAPTQQPEVLEEDGSGRGRVVLLGGAAAVVALAAAALAYLRHKRRGG